MAFRNISSITRKYCLRIYFSGPCFVRSYWNVLYLIPVILCVFLCVAPLHQWLQLPHDGAVFLCVSRLPRLPVCSLSRSGLHVHSPLIRPVFCVNARYHGKHCCMSHGAITWAAVFQWREAMRYVWMNVRQRCGLARTFEIPNYRW